MQVYSILEANSLGDLELAVNHYLREGWECQGGPFINDGKFHQSRRLTDRLVGMTEHQRRSVPSTTCGAPSKRGQVAADYAPGVTRIVEPSAAGLWEFHCSPPW